MNKIWKTAIKKLSKALPLSIAMLLTSQGNAKDIEQYNNTSHNTLQLDKELFFNLDSSNIPKNEINHPIDTVLNPSDHIIIQQHDDIITITIDALYTQQLGLIGEYICNLIQDKDDKNYYIFHSNINTLWVERETVKEYCKNNGFNDIIDKVDDLPENIIEAILLILTKDIKQDKLFQQVYNYRSRLLFDSCGEQDIHAKKIIISDIFKEYNNLSNWDLYEKLNEKLDKEDLTPLEKEIITNKLNKIPYIFD